MVITPIQLNFDGLDLVLRRRCLPMINISRHALASLGQRVHPVEIEAALLQLGRAPILIGGATMAPYIRCKRIPGIWVAARYSRTGRGRGLVGAANKSNGKYC